MDGLEAVQLLCQLREKGSQKVQENSTVQIVGIVEGQVCQVSSRHCLCVVGMVCQVSSRHCLVRIGMGKSLVLVVCLMESSVMRCRANMVGAVGKEKSREMGRGRRGR